MINFIDVVKRQIAQQLPRAMSPATPDNVTLPITAQQASLLHGEVVWHLLPLTLLAYAKGCKLVLAHTHLVGDELRVCRPDAIIFTTAAGGKAGWGDMNLELARRVGMCCPSQFVCPSGHLLCSCASIQWSHQLNVHPAGAWPRFCRGFAWWEHGAHTSKLRQLCHAAGLHSAGAVQAQ